MVPQAMCLRLSHRGGHTVIDVGVIAAMTEIGGVLGRDGTIPWDVPEDREHFRSRTWACGVVIGRNTYRDILRARSAVGYTGQGPLLPGRYTTVVSSGPQILPGATWSSSLDAALACLEDVTERAWVAGGPALYREALPRADWLSLTYVEQLVTGGDAVFPPVEWDDWEHIATLSGVSVRGAGYSISDYLRKSALR